MIKDEQQFQKELKQAKTGALIFFIISMSLFALSVALVVISIIVGSKDPESWYPYGYGAGLCMSLGFTFIILRSVFFTSKVRFLMMIEQNESQTKQQFTETIDATPVQAFTEENSRENKLFQQYENLYNQGYITKEELEQKRKELLGK